MLVYTKAVSDTDKYALAFVQWATKILDQYQLVSVTKTMIIGINSISQIWLGCLSIHLQLNSVDRQKVHLLPKMYAHVVSENTQFKPKLVLFPIV